MTETQQTAVEASEEAVRNFTFEHGGKTYAFEGSLEIANQPGFIRKNRHRNEIDLLFTLLEEIAGEEALAAIDEMDVEEFASLNEEMTSVINKHNEALRAAAKKK